MKCKDCFYYEDYDGEEGYCNFIDADVSANDSCCDFENAEETEGDEI